MRLRVKGKNIEVSAADREYVEEKLAKLDRQLAADTEIEVEFAEERNPSIAADHVTEATVFTKGSTLRVRATAADFRTALDELVDNLQRQLQRYRDKRREEPRRRTNHHE
ncbi:MAG: ribosome-associated translation inhibitor RaiA [Actinomycetes bacterium]